MNLRGRVANELARLLHGGGLDDPWSDRTDASTRWLYSDGDLYAADRLRFHYRLVDEVRAQQSASSGGSMTAVVTAGPPGAGKSTVLDGASSMAGFRHVDADSFKDALLGDAQQRGLLQRWTATSLSDGRPVAPRELAGFVHAESTAVADAMRDACLAAGEDLIIHGTLSSAAYVDQLLAELDDYGYAKLVIYDVEVPAAQAIEQALGRWWRVREAGKDPLGGRFVPPDAIGSYFAADSERSRTATNAIALRDRAEALGWDVELNIVDDRDR